MWPEPFRRSTEFLLTNAIYFKVTLVSVYSKRSAFPLMLLVAADQLCFKSLKVDQDFAAVWVPDLAASAASAGAWSGLPQHPIRCDPTTYNKAPNPPKALYNSKP